jgi:hypothetical protein
MARRGTLLSCSRRNAAAMKASRDRKRVCVPDLRDLEGFRIGATSKYAAISVPVPLATNYGGI